MGSEMCIRDRGMHNVLNMKIELHLLLWRSEFYVITPFAIDPENIIVGDPLNFPERLHLLSKKSTRTRLGFAQITTRILLYAQVERMHKSLIGEEPNLSTYP